MRKWVTKVLVLLIFASGILLLFSTYLTLQVFRDNSEFFNNGPTSGRVLSKYHLALALPSDTDPFFQRLLADLQKEAGIESALEVFTFGPGRRFTELTDFLEKSILARVDGILLCIKEEPGIEEMINRAVSLSIPVICMVYDTPSSRRQTFVGANSFQWGFDLGKLLNQKTRGTGSVTVLLNNTSPLLLSGFQKFLKEKPQSGTVQIRQADSFTGLESEELLWEILSRDPPGTLICTNLRDTLSGVQMLIELNRVGSTAIIGFDDTSETRELIKSGLLFGSMVPKPREIAHKSYEAMIELIRKQNVSSYIDVNLSVLTRETLSAKDQENIRGR